MTKSSDARQDLIGGFGPHEGLGLLVRVRNVGPDGRLKCLGAAMHSAPQLFLGEQGKPALHQIQPGGAGRCKVDMEAWALEQPPSDQGGLMRARVVEDEMPVQLCRNRCLNRVEELAEFTAALSLVELPDHLTRFDVQGGKQRGGAVASIVVRAPFDLPRAHRQQRSRPVQRLNLGFLIHAQHQRFIWWIHVQADDVSDLFDKERILGKLERFGPMRLQAERPPDPADSTLTQAAGLCHVPATPVGARLGRRLQRQRQEPLHLCIASASPGARARFIEQAVQPPRDKAPPPTAYRLARRVELSCHCVVGLAGGTSQHEPGTASQSLCGLGATGPLFKGVSFFVGQHQRGFRASRAHRCPPG